MNKYLNDFLLMLQFLTRIPVNMNLNCGHENFRRGAMFLPIVGFIIGGTQWVFYYLLNKLFPSTIISVILVVAAVLLTGALHVDGLGDTCDGFFAFKGRERIIEIMKDSRIGTYACIAIIADILLKITAYDHLIRNSFSNIIIAVPILARFAIVLISFIGKPAKSTGSGNLFIGNMKLSIMFVAGVFAMIMVGAFIGFREASIIFVATIVITFLCNKYSYSKIGGLTGDILGATNELVEIGCLLVYIAVIKLLG